MSPDDKAPTTGPDERVGPASAAPSQATAASLGPRQHGAINWVGFWTLYAKEVKRFIKVYLQTIMAPVITTLLFYTVFALALDAGNRTVAGISYLAFLGPGLIMMGITQNAFANTSSTVIIAKVQGNIVDVLLPPLSSLELAMGWILGGVTRGLVVGVFIYLSLVFFVDIPISNPALVLFHAISGSLMLSTLGVIGGIWSDKFDHIAAVTNFVVTPLTFLSGTFYSVERLPEEWLFMAHLNPFFYMIDGFRAGFIGHADGNLTIGLLVGVVINVVLLALALRMLHTGYKLRP
ncbi:MAG: ABC transporter permease [Pseudomonadota bacterium]